MSSLTLVRRIAARPRTVFDALTSAEGMANWWGPDDGAALEARSDARVGGEYLVRFRTADGKEHEARGHYYELRPPERVCMSFRWMVGGTSEEVGRVSRIEVDLRPVEGGTELTFTHADLQDESKASHEWGWGAALEKLSRSLESRREHAFHAAS